jgi:hypothetical protein
LALNAFFGQRVLVGLGFGNKLAQRQFGGGAEPGQHAVIDRDHVGLRDAPPAQPRIVFNQIDSSGQTEIAWAGERNRGNNAVSSSMCNLVAWSQHHKTHGISVNGRSIASISIQADWTTMLGE